MREVYIDGRLRERLDDAARQYTTWDALGNETFSGPYTPEQASAADMRAVSRLPISNETNIRDRIKSQLDANRNAITSLENFAAGTGALTNTQRDNALRDLANQVARSFRQLNALIKLEAKDLASTEGT